MREAWHGDGIYLHLPYIPSVGNYFCVVPLFQMVISKLAEQDPEFCSRYGPERPSMPGMAGV